MEALERRLLMATFSVTNTSDAGAGSLRQAITDANGAAGADLINFNIAGAGVHTISPTSQLPDITEAVTINGYSQPGASANTLANGNDAVLLIELEGTNAGVGVRALTLDASNITVRGLVINRFPFGISASSGTANHVIAGNFFGTNAAGSAVAVGGFQSIGILLDGASDSTVGGTNPADRNLFAGYSSGLQIQDAPRNTVQGNFFGTNAAGTAALSTSTIQIVSFTDGSSNNLIGGTAAGARNVISGNSSGISLNGGGQDNTIQGNFLGTSVTGQAALGGAGIQASGTRNLQIGGTAAGARNLISGVQGTAISLSTTDATIQGNFIGVAADGTTALANGSTGIQVGAGSTSVVIGGVAAGAANIIANNANTGIGVSSGASTGTRILYNSIYNNTVLGIDLGGDGPTANDTLDPDTGANNLQNSPVLSKPVVGGSLTTVAGTLNSLANTAFTVQIFTSDNFSLAGIGQGKTLLATLTVNTNGSGNGTFTTDIANATIPQGTLLTATATNNATGDTSEFCKIAVVTAFTVINTSQTGAGSLDNAVKGSELVDGLDNIFFNIPGSGVQTISLQGLYQITGPVVIDGFTQPGASANTLAVGDDSVHLIEIKGLHNYFANFTGAGNTVRGLIMNQWVGVSALRFSGAGGNVIEGNWIGLDADGATVSASNSRGISIEGSPNNRIGGLLPAQRNVISGNSSGILIGSSLVSENVSGTVIQGNYFGTNAQGTAASTGGNSSLSTAISIALNDTTVPPGILIGGSAAGAGNLISGNRAGITTSGKTTNTIIQGNFIGTDVTGTQPIGNTQIGIDMGGNSTSPTGNSVGGVNPGEGNIIAFNGSGGVENGGIGLFRNGSTTFGINTPILGNRIFGNNGLAIDADDDGATANDFQDVDAGSNNLQNYPLITSAVQNGGNIDVVGTLNSTPNTTFRIEFFTVSSTGGVVLGSASVTTDANGDAAIAQSFAGTLGADLVTATATDPNGNTSEYFPVNTPVNVAGTLSVGPVTVAESAGNASVTISRVGGSTGSISVDITTSNSTAVAGQDYTAVTQTVTFANGETSKIVLIPISNDTDVENSEALSVTLSNVTGGAVLGTTSAAVTITDDDVVIPAGPIVQFSLPNYSVSEAGGSVTITVIRSDPTGAATVDFTTADSTAINGQDYTAVAQTLSFADGQFTQDVVIPILQDTTSESSESVALGLSNFSAGTVSGSNPTATVTIVDDDRPPLIATGTFKGKKMRVQLFNALTQQKLLDFQPFSGSNSELNVRVALADVTGDGNPDIVAGISEEKSLVRVFDGLTGVPIAGPLGEFKPYSYGGGSYLAAGDLNDDGRAEIIVGSDKSKHAEVKVYDGATGALRPGALGNFNAYTASKKVFGAMPAIGDINGDGNPDVVIGTSHGGSDVRVFDGTNATILQSFTAFSPSYKKGIFVTTGDFSGLGRDQIVTSVRDRAGGAVRFFADGGLVREFPPAGSSFKDGLSVAALDLTSDGLDDLVVGIGRKNGNHVVVFRGTDLAELSGFRVIESRFSTKVHVAAE